MTWIPMFPAKYKVTRYSSSKDIEPMERKFHTRVRCNPMKQQLVGLGQPWVEMVSGTCRDPHRASDPQVMLLKTGTMPRSHSADRVNSIPEVYMFRPRTTVKYLWTT